MKFKLMLMGGVMAEKCSYCGAELPVEADSETRCPVCGEIPAEQTASSPALKQPPPEPQPAPAYSPPAQPPPTQPGQTAHQTAGGQTQPGPTEHTPAWELDGGFWLAKLWKTIWQVLLHPVLTFAAPGRLQQQKYPLGFGMILGVLGMVLNAFMNQFLPELMQSKIPGFYMVLMAPLTTIVALYVGAGIMHLFLIMVGAAKGGYAATFRVNAYAMSYSIFDAIPLLGSFVAMVWGLVVQVGGMAAAHGTTYGRVIGAMLLGFASLLVLILLIVLAVVFGSQANS